MKVLTSFGQIVGVARYFSTSDSKWPTIGQITDVYLEENKC